MSECKVAVLTEAQLREIVGEAVRAALREGPAPVGADEPRWYDTVRAAKYLGLSRASLLKHVERGHLRPDNRNAVGRVSGHRFRRETLDRFFEGSK